MTQEQFESDALTDAQRNAMVDIQKESGISWEDFLEKCDPPGSTLTPYVSVHNFHGMFVGIEKDGYTHFRGHLGRLHQYFYCTKCGKVLSEI